MGDQTQVARRSSRDPQGLGPGYSQGRPRNDRGNPKAGQPCPAPQLRDLGNERIPREDPAEVQRLKESPGGIRPGRAGPGRNRLNPVEGEIAVFYGKYNEN